jgi:hypothetical protein
MRTVIAICCLLMLRVGAVARCDDSTAAKPAGAARVEDSSLRSNLGTFLAAVAEERNARAAGGPAEVLLWSGSDYRAGRTALTRAAVQRELEAAGFKLQEFGREDLRHTPFDPEFGLFKEEGPFPVYRPSSTESQRYFVARSASKKQALIGAWFDQEDQKKLFLAVAGLVYKPDATEAPIPAPDANGLMVKDHFDAMKGVVPSMPAFPAMKAAPGHVHGMVKDLAGRPLAGAKILVESSLAGGVKTTVTTRTDANGVYDIVAPKGACRITMTSYALPYNGHTLVLPLHPVRGETAYFDTGAGHVENFTLLTCGTANRIMAEQRPEFDSSYYGGSVGVRWMGTDIPKGGTIEVTLEPRGTLVGGAKGRTLLFRLPNNDFGGDTSLNDIPLGRYVLRARLLEDGEAIPLKVQKRTQSETSADSLVVEFASRESDLCVINSGGTKRFDVTIHP